MRHTPHPPGHGTHTFAHVYGHLSVGKQKYKAK